MKRLDQLITQARNDTDNDDYSDTTGIPDTSFIQWVNDAQERLQALISAVNPDLFQETEETDAVSGQEEYDLPSDLLLDTKVEGIEYSATGQEQDYDELDPITRRERTAGDQGRPVAYVRQSGQFLSCPAPDTTGGKFRVTYQRRLPGLDIRRGFILDVVVSTDSIVSLTLEPSELTSDNIDHLEDVGYATCVDALGNVKMRGIPILGVDQDTGVVSLDPTFEFEDGETIEAGDYLVAGEYHTSHSQLPHGCERYLIAYMSWKAQKKDSSYDSDEASSEKSEMEQEIVEAYKKADRTVKTVPIINDDYLC